MHNLSLCSQGQFANSISAFVFSESSLLLSSIPIVHLHGALFDGYFCYKSITSIIFVFKKFKTTVTILTMNML